MTDFLVQQLKEEEIISIGPKGLKGLIGQLNRFRRDLRNSIEKS